MAGLGDGGGAGPEEVVVAIETALRLRRGNQAEANVWVGEFSQTDGAWEVALAIVDAADGSVAHQVRFFAATMLMTKIRSQWGSTDAEVQGTVYNALWERVQPGEVEVDEDEAKLRECLSLGLATAAAQSGGEMLVHFVGRAIEMTVDSASSATVKLALELIHALAHATLRRPHKHKSEVVEALQTHMAAILSVCESILGDGGDLAVLVLQTITAIIPAGASLAALHAHKPSLLSTIVSGLGTTEPRVFRFVVELLIEMLGDAAVVVAPGSPGRPVGAGPVDPVLGDQISGAIFSLADAFALHQSLFEESIASGNTDVCQGLCQVAVGIGEVGVREIALGNEAANVVVEVLLECSQHEDISIRALPCQFWPLLHNVPAEERAEHMRQPLFRRLLERLLRGGTYSGKELDDDEFQDYRQREAADCIDACFVELQGEFVKYLSGLLEHATVGDGGWETADVVLYATGCCHLSVKGMLRVVDPSEAFVHSQHEVEDYLQAVFELIGSQDGSVTDHPAVIVSGVRCAHWYSSWLAKREHLTDGVVGYLLASLNVPLAAEKAAEAFRTVVSRCAARFNTEENLRSLVEALDGAVDSGLSLEARVTFVQAISRIVATSALDDVAPKMLAVLESTSRRLEGSLSSDPGSDESAKVVEAELKVLAAALQFCGGQDVRAGQTHPVTALTSECFAIVASVAESPLGRRPIVTAAVCECCDASLHGARQAGSSTLDQLCTLVVNLFEETGHAACLSTLGVMVEVHGSTATSDRDVEALLGRALSAMCERAGRLITEKESEDDNAEVLSSLFQMADQVVLFVPALALSLESMEPLLSTALQCIGHPDRYVALAALRFVRQLTLVALKGDVDAESRERVVSLMSPIIQDCIVAIVATAAMPTTSANLFNPLADTLHAFLDAGVEVPEETCRRAAEDAFGSAKEGALSDEMMHAFINATLAGGAPIDDHDLFRRVVEDFATVCRGGEGSGALASFC